MAHYMFPTSYTEGENYFVQFDIYKLKFPIKQLVAGHAEALAVHSDPATYGYVANREVPAAPAADDANAEPVGFLDSMKNLYGTVTTNLRAIKDTIKDWQNTYNYEQQANEILNRLRTTVI